MKVFLGIKYLGDDSNKQFIKDISSLLTSKGFEITNIIRDIEKWGERNLDPQELMSETIEMINRCDIVLIELSVKGVGLGIEAGYAFAKRKPIIVIANSKGNISKSLDGISTATLTYNSLEKLDRFFDGLRNVKEPKVMFPEKRPNLDLLLLNTPQYDYSVVPFRSYVSLPPLGLAYIATWLDNRGFSVELLDGEHHGLSPKSIARIVNEKKPRFLGINLLTPTYHIAASIVEEIDSETTIMVGGAHANALPMEVMNDPRMKKVTFLVLGDGEYKIEGLLRGSHKPENIPGIVSRKSGEVVFNPDQPLDDRWTPRNLDELPFIDRRFLDSDPFTSEGRLEATMVASRGCPFSCSFCSASYNNMIGNRPRVRLIPNILEEIRFLNIKYGITAIRFVDNLLLGNIPFIRAFATALVDSGLNRRLVWQANARVSLLWNAPYDVIENLALSGCRQLSIGIESGSQRILDYISKKITTDQSRTLVKRLSLYGIRASGYFIIGLPGETREEIRTTISLFHELREISRQHVNKPTAIFRGNLFEFRPYPKTVEWQKVLSMGFSTDDLLNSYYPLVIGGLDERMKRRWSNGLQFSEVPPEEIQQLIRDALLKQNEDLERYGGLPDFAWDLRNEDRNPIQESITRIVCD